MKTIELVIQNSSGLHARPAKVLVSLAKQFNAAIHIQHGQKNANAKSMVSVLTLGVVSGSHITIQANGSDEERALAEIETAIRAGLGDNDLSGEPQAVEKLASPTIGTESSKPEVASTAPAPAPANQNLAPGTIKGVGAAPGIGIGPLFNFQHPILDTVSTTNAAQRMSLQDASAQARAELSQLAAQMVNKKLDAEAVIFQAHAELLDDPELQASVEAHVAAGTSEIESWKAAVDEHAAAIGSLSDPLLAARASDVRDVGQRILRLMLGVNQESIALPNYPVIVIARDLSPSDAVSFEPERVLGFAIVEGGPTSHIAILARAMGIPAIVGANDGLLNAQNGTMVILDANDGTVTYNPDAALVARATQAQQEWLSQRRLANAQADLPATTIDGHCVEVTANAGSAADAVAARQHGADGIGLLRTEFLFLDRATAPTEQEQFEIYRSVAETMQHRPVIVRTLDIGGDKPLPYIQLKPEMNPFLGERGIRLCLNRPGLFREQLRAILRAAPSGNLRIMFPMVSDISEVRQARAIVEDLRRELYLPALQIGIMIEVPSAALLADKFAPEIDFFSIGTNDLTQYTLAIDRAHPALASRHDGLHPAVLRLIAQTIDAAHQYGKRADLCGELGSDSAAVPILVGLGIDELSVSIPVVPTVKALVRTLRLSDLQPLARQALTCATAQEVRDLVQEHFNHKT